jgi:hypothetical protein
MTKPKTCADLARSFDADWPPHQPITLMDLVAGARTVDWDFTTWCASGPGWFVPNWLAVTISPPFGRCAKSAMAPVVIPLVAGGS